MAKELVCPWWLGYALACPIRRLFQSPEKILVPYVRAGMTALEPGPGMGFFTLELARRVGDDGRVVAVEIQPKMLAVLERRAAKAGLRNRVETRLVRPDSMGLADLAGKVDFALAFAMVHEMPDTGLFFREVSEALKPGGTVLLVEPGSHVKTEKFAQELALAAEAGLSVVERPKMGRSHAAVLRKQ
jgi:ubiquinone/menaquinone biosynthesis C-methylase UbiE